MGADWAAMTLRYGGGGVALTEVLVGRSWYVRGAYCGVPHSSSRQRRRTLGQVMSFPRGVRKSPFHTALRYELQLMHSRERAPVGARLPGGRFVMCMIVWVA